MATIDRTVLIAKICEMKSLGVGGRGLETGRGRAGRKEGPSAQLGLRDNCARSDRSTQEMAAVTW
jgi:hypothetical protein